MTLIFRMDWILSDSIPTDLRHTVWGIVSFIVSGSFHNLLEVNEKQLHTFFYDTTPESYE